MKDTPFFKFDSSAWLGGSIQFTSLECKGLFIDMCALYWESQKPLKIDTKFKVRIRYDEGTLSNLLGTLTELSVIVETEQGYKIPFLDKLMSDRRKWLQKCSDAGKKSKGTSSNKKEERREKKVESRKKIFKAPELWEVKAYFCENGYTEKSAVDAFEYYQAGNWHDSQGNKVKSWKQKMRGVWFKKENLVSRPASEDHPF